MTDSAILHYQPGKGAGFGHAFTVRGVRRAWESVERFLTEFADADPPCWLRLTAFRATEWDDAAKADAGIALVRDRFGTPTQDERGLGKRWPSGEPIPGGSCVWELAPESLADALAFLASGEPWWKQTLGPVELTVSYRFRWRLPDALSVPYSDLLVTFGRRSFVQPELWLPFAPYSAAHAAFEREIAPALPFALTPRHFLRATPLAKGPGYAFHKIAQPRAAE